MEKPSRLVFFEFVKGSPDDGQEWLQITSVTNIGDIGREIKQKIIRLNAEDSKELYNKLKTKYA